MSQECWNLHQNKSFISVNNALGKVLPHMSGPPPPGCIHTILEFFCFIFTSDSSSESWCWELEAEAAYGNLHIPGFERSLLVCACLCWFLLNKISPQFELTTVVQESCIETSIASGSHTNVCTCPDLKKKNGWKLNGPILSQLFPWQGNPNLRTIWDLR